MKKNKSYDLRLVVIAVPTITFALITLIGFIDSNAFVDLLWGLFEKAMTNLGWLIELASLAFFVFLMFLWFHPVGKIKFGGPNAKPKYSTWNWWAISLCAGISTGILFWGAAEPLQHTMNPAQALNLEPGSYEAAMWGLKSSLINWTIIPYTIIAIPGIVLGYAYYNMNQPYCVSSGFVPLLGKKALSNKFSNIVDSITLFAITGGVAGSLGYGLLLIGSGLDQVFGIKPSPLIWLLTAIFIVTCYCLSSLSGLDKGIKWLSDKNATIFIVILCFTLVLGPTQFIFNISTQAVGDFVNNFVSSMTFTSPYLEADLWPQWWPMFCFVDWLAFAPIIGLFLVKLSYGRTIREFITVNLFGPALFGLLWFCVFGGTSIYLQTVQGVDLIGFMTANGSESMGFKVFDFLPLSGITKPIMLLIICLSFITLADSMTSTVSLMSIKSKEKMDEAPMGIKLFWGILMGVTSLIFLFNGGLEGIKVVKTLAGIPILFLQIMMMLGFIKLIRSLIIKNRKPNVYEILETSELNPEVEKIST